MPTQHTVEAGECLSSITKKYGFSDYKTIYDSPLDTEFKRNHPNPKIIYDGDVVVIPDKKLKELPISTEKQHPFRTKREKTFICRLKILEARLSPTPNIN